MRPAVLLSLFVLVGCHHKVQVAGAAAPDLESRAESEAKKESQNGIRIGQPLHGLATARDEYTDFQVGLEADNCYVFGYAGDATVEKFSFYVWDSRDRRVMTQRGKPPQGSVVYCPPFAGSFKVEGKVSDGAGHFALVVYRQGKAGGGPTTSSTATTAPTSSVPVSSMSETERKSTARVAFTDGLAFQDNHDCANALPKFEAAERLYDAPTQRLHIAQCQVELYKLVEAQETYEALAHETLSPSSSDAFKDAKEQAKRDLPGLKARIPSLKVVVTPATATGLAVTVNGRPLSSDVFGLSRPVNPGVYAIGAGAKGYRAWAQDLDIKEGESKVADVRLSK